MPEDPSLSTVIGANVRRCRESRRWTQDEFSSLLKNLGLGLSQSGVATAESGSRSIDVGELLILAHALDVDVADLFAGSGKVRLTDSTSADLRSVADCLHGVRTPSELHLNTPVARLAGWATSEQKRIKKTWPNARPAQIVHAERGMDGLAEQKAARALGARAFDVSMAAIELWGETLTEHRNAIVAERTSADTSVRSVQAIRGRVTRNLIDEIQPRLKV